MVDETARRTVCVRAYRITRERIGSHSRPGHWSRVRSPCIEVRSCTLTSARLRPGGLLYPLHHPTTRSCCHPLLFTRCIIQRVTPNLPRGVQPSSQARMTSSFPGNDRRDDRTDGAHTVADFYVPYEYNMPPQKSQRSSRTKRSRRVSKRSFATRTLKQSEEVHE